jgi:branched-chain amino acid transport system permease protein
MSSSAMLQFLFSGITSGAVYAFVALAFSVTFNSSGIVNFAQGQFVMIGGMVASSLHTAFNVSVFPAIALAIWGTDPRALPSLLDMDALRVGGAYLSADTILIVTMILFTLVAFSLFIHYTRWGRAMRATSIDTTISASLGVNVPLTIVLAFVLSAAFGGLAGVLFTPLISTSSQTGLLMTLKGFTGAVLGGMSSPVGSVVGGFALGLIEAFATGFISSTYQNAIGLGLMILLLMARPQGLFTRTTRQA